MAKDVKRQRPQSKQPIILSTEDKWALLVPLAAVVCIDAVEVVVANVDILLAMLLCHLLDSLGAARLQLSVVFSGPDTWDLWDS